MLEVVLQSEFQNTGSAPARLGIEEAKGWEVRARVWCEIVVVVKRQLIAAAELRKRMIDPIERRKPELDDLTLRDVERIKTLAPNKID